jgi:hypothetical protein
MMELKPADRANRFYTSTCPVCRELALEAFVSAQVVQFECGRCGGFGITATARSMLAKRSEEERKAWLNHARRQAPANGQTVLVDAGDDRKPGDAREVRPSF